MPLTPAEIIHWQFRRRLFGYSVKDVKEFVQRVSETVAELMEENRSLKEEREKLLDRLQTYQSIEKQLHNALVIAEKTADEIKRQAQREAELIVAQARQEAEQTKANARLQVQAAMDEMEQIRKLKVRLETEMRHMLLSYLELLEKGTRAYETIGKPEEEPLD